MLALATTLDVLGDLALDKDTDAAGDALDTTAPDLSVEGRVDAVVLRLHHLLGDLTDTLDGLGGTASEGDTLDVLGEVDGGLVGGLVGLASAEGGLAVGSTGDTADANLGGIASTSGAEELLLRVVGGHLGGELLPLLVLTLLLRLGVLVAGLNDRHLLVLGTLGSLSSGKNHGSYCAEPEKREEVSACDVTMVKPHCCPEIE